MQRIKKASIIAALCVLLLASVLLQLVSPSSAYFLSLFDKLGVNSVKVELIFDRLDFDDPDIIGLGTFREVDADGNEIPWGSEQNPYVISQKFHIQNLSVLQNSGFFKGRVEIDADGNEVPAQSYFLVCNPDGTPVAIDCEGMKIEPVGTTELPFTGVIKGAPLAGTATYKNYGVSTSTVANLVVDAKVDTPDLGFFGYVGYYGKYDKNTATLTDGYASTIENLLFADVTVKSSKSLLESIIETLEAWWEMWTTPAIDPDSGDEVELDHTHFDEQRAETHHVGIIAGHAEFATIKNVSVYYSEGVAAFDLVSNESGSITNYYSSTGLIGLLQYVNPVENADGTLDGSGGISDNQIIGDGEGGGGEESGTLTGYFLAEFLFEEHEKYLTAQNMGTKDSYDVKEMLKEDGSQLFETVVMKEGVDLGILDFTEDVTYYFFRDSVFTFAMSMSASDTTGADYVEKIWQLEEEAPEIFATDSVDKWKYVDDFTAPPRISYRLTAVESAPTSAGHYVLIYHDDNGTEVTYDDRYYALNIMDGKGKYAYDITEAMNTDGIADPYYEGGELKEINLIGNNSTYYDYSFYYQNSTYRIKDPNTSSNYRFGLTSTYANNTHSAPTFHYGTDNQNASGTGWLIITYNTNAFLYNWNFAPAWTDSANGKFTVSFDSATHGTNASGTDIHYWAMLEFDSDANAIVLETDCVWTDAEETGLSNIADSKDSTNHFTLMKLTANTVDNQGNITVKGDNFVLDPKNLLPVEANKNATTGNWDIVYDKDGNPISTALYSFDPSTHVLEALGDGTYKLAPIRSYRLNNGKGDLLYRLNHRVKLFKTLEENFSLNFGSNFTLFNQGGVVGAQIGTGGGYYAIPTGMMAFDIREASPEAPSFINIIVAVNPEQTTLSSVGLWKGSTGITSNFEINNPMLQFALPISKTAASDGDTEKSYMIHVTERLVEEEVDGRLTYRKITNSDGTNEESFVYLGGEVAFVYHSFEVTETGIYLVGSMAGPLSVSYFSVSGAAGAGSDGMSGSPLGMIDFVYDYNGNIITVDKHYTDEQFVSNENYEQYYPSFLFVSMLPEKDGNTLTRIQREQINLRRYIDEGDSSGTRRHMKMTGENLTTLRGVSEILQDLQDDIDND